MHYKTVSNWRQIIKGPEAEFCSSSKLGGLLPLYRNRLEEFKIMFPHLPFFCPIEPGPLYVRDFVDKDPLAYQQNDTVRFGFELPNGRYRFIIKWYTKTDPIFFLVQWQLVKRYRLGEEYF